MSRRLLALVCVSASLASGCGLMSEDGAGERRTVTVWLMKDSASQDFLKRFTEGFEREHPTSTSTSGSRSGPGSATRCRRP